MIQCNHDECNEDISHMMGDSIEAHSAVAVLQKVDKTGYTFFQCEDGQEVNFVTYQHFHCSHAHMQEGLLSCVKQHYTEEMLHPIPVGGGSTILHRMVLGSKLTCKACQAPLVEKAYRFCLTRCTPYNSVPDGSQDALSEWCCSLEHATQSAIAIIQNIEE